MASSLKDNYKFHLSLVMAANLALFYAVSQNDTIMAANWSSLARNLGEMFPAGFGIAMTGIINAQLSAVAKSRIVFIRWSHPLPGCEAFTRYANSDSRVDTASLESAYGPLPTDPREQNALWYRLYKSVESEPSVTQVHRAFLFARDCTSLALIMTVLLGFAGFFLIPSMRVALSYLVLLLLQFFLAGQAARNQGKRFVTTVLAIKGVER